MHRARIFFYVSAGVLCLALAFHLGAVSATAQAPGNPVVAGGYGPNNAVVAITLNGDTYTSTNGVGWQPRDNVFAAGPVPATRETFGALKSRYRGTPGAAQQATQDR